MNNGRGVVLCALLGSVVVAVLFVVLVSAQAGETLAPAYGAPAPPAGEELLQRLWRGKGLLNTSLTLQQACAGHFGPGSKDCPVSASECRGGVVNVADFASLSNLLATPDNGTSCFSLATTLQTSRLAQVAFGPFLAGPGARDANEQELITGDMTVGVFLDLVPLQKYIACMSPLDAGSVGRYGNEVLRTRQAMKISSERLTRDYQGVLDECASSDECGFFMAGCGGSQGTNPNKSQVGEGYHFVEEPYRPLAYEGEKGGPWIPKGWLYLDDSHGTPGTAAFFPGTDRGLAAFEETTLHTQRIVGQQADPEERKVGSHCDRVVKLNAPEAPQLPQADPKASYENSCGDYWSYQYLNSKNSANGYRENEVDLFVPQKPSARPEMGAGMRCAPDDGFVKAFREAVVGVYATKYCAKDVQFNERNASGCCNLDVSKAIAVAMAQRYNSAPGVPRKIEAWVWDVADPVGRWSPPEDPSKGRLKISRIQPPSNA